MAARQERQSPRSPRIMSPNSDTQVHDSGSRSAKSNTDRTTAEARDQSFSETTTQEIGADATASESRPATGKAARRKRNRNRRRRNRRHSFLTAEDSHFGSPTVSTPDAAASTNLGDDQPKVEVARPLYKLGRDLSSTSLESEALLDHRYVSGSALAQLL